jgi:hypothetical protein
MMKPYCAVCGKTKITDLRMFNYGICLCNLCTGIAAQSFIHDIAERKMKETEKKRESVDVEGLSKAEYESMTEFKDRLRKEIEASIETKVHAESEAKRKASRTAEAAIKFANGTHEALRGKCSCYGKAVHPSRITRVHGKYGGLPDILCPDCLKEYKLKKAEEATQVYIADLSIENNRLRTKLKDLEKAHSDFSDRCFWFFWILLGIGVAAGIIFSDIFK